MESNWEVRAEKFMKLFLKFIPDYKEFEDYDMLEYVSDGIETFNRKYHRKVQLACGSARLVLLGPDYVIKIDYDHRYCENIGGCEREYAIYMMLRKRKYAYLLAPIYRFEINGTYYYAMPRYDGLETDAGEYRYNWTTEEVKFLRKYTTDLHDENVAMVNGKGIVIDYACPPEKYDFDRSMGYSAW